MSRTITPVDGGLPGTVTPGTPVTASFPDLAKPIPGGWELKLNLSCTEDCPMSATVEVFQDQSQIDHGEKILATSSFPITTTPADHTMFLDGEDCAKARCHISELKVRVTTSVGICSSSSSGSSDTSSSSSSSSFQSSTSSGSSSSSQSSLSSQSSQSSFGSSSSTPSSGSGSCCGRETYPNTLTLSDGTSTLTLYHLGATSEVWTSVGTLCNVSGAWGVSCVNGAWHLHVLQTTPPADYDTVLSGSCVPISLSGSLLGCSFTATESSS